MKDISDKSDTFEEIIEDTVDNKVNDMNSDMIDRDARSNNVVIFGATGSWERERENYFREHQHQVKATKIDGLEVGKGNIMKVKLKDNNSNENYAKKNL